MLDGYTGQARAERGWRFLQAPPFLASSRARNTPARLMALLLGRTICWLVSAALEYRMRTAREEPAAPWPARKGKRLQTPTARWGCHYCGGMPVWELPQPSPIVINLDRRAPAPTPTPGQAVCQVLQMQRHRKQSLNAECRLDHFDRRHLFGSNGTREGSG